jgi:hypothetical protein
MYSFSFCKSTEKSFILFENISTQFSPPFASFGSPGDQFTKLTGVPSDHTNPAVVVNALKPIQARLILLDI